MTKKQELTKDPRTEHQKESGDIVCIMSKYSLMYAARYLPQVIEMLRDSCDEGYQEHMNTMISLQSELSEYFEYIIPE